MSTFDDIISRDESIEVRWVLLQPKVVYLRRRGPGQARTSYREIYVIVSFNNWFKGLIGRPRSNKSSFADSQA